MSTIREHLEFGVKLLAGRDAARLEAEILLAHTLRAARSVLFAHPGREVPPGEAERYRELLQRRATGEPVAYLVGEREFWSLRLRVTPDVLIPRPETELLVERLLELLPRQAGIRIADLGAGSGAIALAVASERPEWEVHATELSEAALAVARDNARRLGLERVHFHHGSWDEPLPGLFHALVSNPPYVREGDPHLLEGDCRFEPPSALTPGVDGLGAFRAIVASSSRHLLPGGWLLLEHGPDQGEAVRLMLKDAGFENVATTSDLLGHERVSGGRTGNPRDGIAG